MIDILCFSADTPVLWLRIDPDMTILRTVKLEQPDWMWQYMLRYERCVCAQSAVSSVSHLLSIIYVDCCKTFTQS